MRPTTTVCETCAITFAIHPTGRMPRFCSDRCRKASYARRFESGRWPSFMAVVHVFGSWNAGIAAAGFEPRPAHGGGGNVARRRNQRVAA